MVASSRQNDAGDSETVAGENRRTDSALNSMAFARAYEFDFFQLVRVLTRAYPDRAPVGHLRDRPSKEVVRFGAEVSLNFPASAVHSVREGEDTPHVMTVTFFGLTGPSGVLPDFYTEHLIARIHRGDRAMADFFDLFNHRLLSLFYRAWEKHQPYVEYERSRDREAGEEHAPDRYSHHLFDIVGMGTPNLRGRLPFADEALLHYAGLIAQRPRSAIAVKRILCDFFQLPVEIDQCVGDWYRLRPEDRCHMESDGLQNALGSGAIAGEEVWDPQAHFRVRVGPLSYDEFREFLPGSDALSTMREWIRFLVGGAQSFWINPILRLEDVPELRLGDEDPESPRLGWTCWLPGLEGGSTGDTEFVF